MLMMKAGEVGVGRGRVDTAVPAPVHHRLLLEVIVMPG
jgi:hypothetical protein